MGEFGLVIRAGTNLAAELEFVGRSEEAVAAAADAARTAVAHGRRDQRAFALGNQAESLHSLGRWDEAAEVIDTARQLASWPHTRGVLELRAAELALSRGDFAAVEAGHRAAVEHYSRQRRREPQKELVQRRLALALAAHRGDWRAARAELAAVLDDGFAVGAHPYAWPLVHTAARAEADLLGFPDAAEGRQDLLDRLRAAQRQLPHPAPVWAAWWLLVGAELDRAERKPAPARWRDVVDAFAPLQRPFQLAQARQRLAEALLNDGGDRAEAAAQLRQARDTAAGLGARTLLEETDQLASRARITLDGASAADDADDAAAVDPAESFGLTGRERDVLALVAAGRSNRQIAAELFISPKTASVHVSNILAKLGVAGRGEAAAMAHRLRLVPTEQAVG